MDYISLNYAEILLLRRAPTSTHELQDKAGLVVLPKLAD